MLRSVEVAQQFGKENLKVDLVTRCPVRNFYRLRDLTGVICIKVRGF